LIARELVHYLIVVVWFPEN